MDKVGAVTSEQFMERANRAKTELKPELSVVRKPPGRKPSPSSVEARDGDDGEHWLASLETVVEHVLRSERVDQSLAFLENVAKRLRSSGVQVPPAVSTPYVNTIPPEEQPGYPGDRELERRIKSHIRWNAMAMVVNANRKHNGIGRPHLDLCLERDALRSGFQPFLPRRQRTSISATWFISKATPRRAIMRARFSKAGWTSEHLHHFRQELAEGGGLSSYPHPYLMPDFWQFPTVSMGLGPFMSIYQARFNRYLKARGFLTGEGAEGLVLSWATAKPTNRSRSARITLAARENLDNLVWVVNCNLQRLDGPVRGNGKIIQELEALFRGAGWNVIKVIWGSDWDALLTADKHGLAAQAHGRSGRWRLPEIFRRARQLHPQTFLRQISRAAGAWSII